MLTRDIKNLSHDHKQVYHQGAPEHTCGKLGDLGISASQILEFGVTWGHFDVVSPNLWHKNGVFDQI